MTSLESLLSEYGVPIAPASHHHATSKFVQVDCPFCSPGTGRYRMGLHRVFLYASCWTCGKHDTLDTLELLTRGPRGELIELVQSLRRNREYIPDPDRPPGKLVLPAGLGPLKRIHRNYLSDRGFDPNQLERLWGLQGIGQSDPGTAWRVFIPAVYRGETVSWTSRKIVDGEPRYWNAREDQEKIPLKSILLGGDYVRNSVVIVEGYFGVARIGPGAVATMGVLVTRAQVSKLARIPHRWVCFDPDEPGQERAHWLCNQLKVYPGRTHNIVVDAEDPGECSRKEVALIRRVCL